MAEEVIDIPATPEPEEIMLEGNRLRSSSTENLIISKSEVKVPSRYLGSSVGSCHDVCKYGIKNIMKKKARCPIPKRIAARPGECQYQSEIVILEVKKKKPLISTKPLADSKSQTTHEKHQVVEKVAPVSAKKIAISSKPFFSPVDRINVSAKYASDLRPKPVQTKPSPFSSPGHLSNRRYSEILPPKGSGGLQANPVRVSSSRRHSDSGIIEEMRTSKLRKKNDLLPPTVFPSPAKPSIKRELTAKSGHYKEPKQAAHLKSQNSVRKAEPKQPIDENVPEKTLYVVEIKPVNPFLRVTKKGNGITCSSQSPSKSSQSPLSTESKKLRHTRNGIHITQTCSSSSLSSEKKCLTRTKNGNRDAPSSSSSLSLLSSSSSSTMSIKGDKKDPISEGSGTKTEKQIANHTSRPRRVGRVVPEGKVNSPRKLNFTRGKVVDVQPKNHSPRILIFKQRRVLGENQSLKADTKQRSFKKVVASSDLNGSETKPTNVGRVVPEGKVRSPKKLNFTRGKVVDVQPKNHSPRILIFKKRRVLGENQSLKADTKLRSFKNVVAAGDLNGSETKPTNVVLRHRAVQGKKGAQNLFNNVIEETASKLVETRKSKVKALVGAFETVISLQDTKPSATTSAS